MQTEAQQPAKVIAMKPPGNIPQPPKGVLSASTEGLEVDNSQPPFPTDTSENISSLLEMEQDTRKQVDEILSFLRPVQSAADRELFDQMTEKELRSFLADVFRVFGTLDTEQFVESASSLIKEVESSPSHEALMRVVDKHIATLVSIAQQAQRAFKCDPIVNALTDSTFTTQAKEAIRLSQILTRGIQELATLIGYPQGNAPLSLNKSLFVLRACAANISAANKYRDTAIDIINQKTIFGETQKARVEALTTQLRRFELSYKEDLLKSRLIPEDMPKDTFVTDGKGRLLSRVAPTARTSKKTKTRLSDYYWSSSYKSACRFTSVQAANDFVDKLVMIEAAKITDSPLDSVKLRGVELNSITTCRLGIVFDV